MGAREMPVILYALQLIWYCFFPMQKHTPGQAQKSFYSSRSDKPISPWMWSLIWIQNYTEIIYKHWYGTEKFPKRMRAREWHREWKYFMYHTGKMKPSFSWKHIKPYEPIFNGDSSLTYKWESTQHIYSRMCILIMETLMETMPNEKKRTISLLRTIYGVRCA